MNSLVVLLTLFVVCSSQIIKFEKCPQFKTQDNFNPARYFKGKFYSQKRFFNFFELGSTCATAEYTLGENARVVVKNSAVNVTLGRWTQLGDAYCEKENPAMCKVRFYENTPYGDYNILETDYDNYGLVYSCRNIMDGRSSLQFAWILTRSKKVSDADMKKYLDVFKRNGVDVSKFNDVAQDCNDN